MISDKYWSISDTCNFELQAELSQNMNFLEELKSQIYMQPTSDQITWQ